MGFLQSEESEERRGLIDGEEAADDGLSMEIEFKRVATEILDRLFMEMKGRFQRLKEHVGRF